MSASGPGIKPVDQEVGVGVGRDNFIIPSGSFRQNQRGFFSFEGRLNNVDLNVLVKPIVTLKYEFKMDAMGLLNLLDPTRPMVPVEVVPLTLTFGCNGGGTANAVAQTLSPPPPSTLGCTSGATPVNAEIRR